MGWVEVVSQDTSHALLSETGNAPPPPWPRLNRPPYSVAYRNLFYIHTIRKYMCVCVKLAEGLGSQQHLHQDSALVNTCK